jgi:hypothetical protein
MKLRLSHFCNVKEAPYIFGKLLMVLIMIVVRFVMACMALFFLPISVMIYPCYFIITYILRRMLFKGRGQRPNKDGAGLGPYFVGREKKSAWNIFFAWDFRGAGYGYLEFGDFEEGEDPFESKQELSADPGGNRYKVRAEAREKQSLLESKSSKSNKGGFSNIV